MQRSIRSTVPAATRSFSGVVQPPASPIWKASHAANPIVVPVSEPFFPAVPSVADGTPATAPVFKSTTLDNGVRVASESHHGFFTSLGLFASAGPRYLSAEHAALPYFFQKAAFKANKRNSHFKVVRDLEKLGATASVEVTRDVVSVNVKSLNHLAPYTLGYISDALRPRLLSHELDEIAHSVEAEAQHLNETPNASLTDAIHAAAFGNHGLGNPTLLTPSLIESVTAADVEAYITSRFTGSNVVIAGHGISHDTLVHESKAQFEHLAKTERQSAADIYVGGDVRLPAHKSSPLTHFAVGLKAPSWSQEDVYALFVLSTILGGGDAFSAGGPGKGMRSLFYLNILNSASVESAIAQAHIYNDTGILSLQGSSDASEVVNVITKFATILKGARDNLSDENFHRGIKQASASVLFNLEQSEIVAEDIGRQILAYNRRHSSAELNAKVQKVTKADISRVITNLLSQPLSFASVGRTPVSTDKIRSIFGQ